MIWLAELMRWLFFRGFGSYVVRKDFKKDTLRRCYGFAFKVGQLRCLRLACRQLSLQISGILVRATQNKLGKTSKALGGRTSGQRFGKLNGFLSMILSR